MKRVLIDILVCPMCLPKQNGLTSYMRDTNGEDILSGALQCGECGASYPVEEGIAFLLPRPSLNVQPAPSKYEHHSVVSSYLWSHYADLMEDTDASTAYKEWAELLGHKSGFSLDAGCAVGRFTFEMSKKSDFAVGIDNSHTFIRKARQLMIDRQLGMVLTEEGVLEKKETLHLPEAWEAHKVEFVVGDVQSLPFRAHFFSTLASMNVVDKVPFPLLHLKEMNRVAKERDAQFLLSDPFSWSSEVARKDDWLGGTPDGPFSGRGIDNITSLLTGQSGEVLPPWKVKEKGHIWWKIRNHQNHFELIRSCYIRAYR